MRTTVNDYGYGITTASAEHWSWNLNTEDLQAACQDRRQR